MHWDWSLEGAGLALVCIDLLYVNVTEYERRRLMGLRPAPNERMVRVLYGQVRYTQKAQWGIM